VPGHRNEAIIHETLPDFNGYFRRYPRNVRLGWNNVRLLGLVFGQNSEKSRLFEGENVDKFGGFSQTKNPGQG
jgi:hypothetical protein